MESSVGGRFFEDDDDEEDEDGVGVVVEAVTDVDVLERLLLSRDLSRDDFSFWSFSLSLLSDSFLLLLLLLLVVFELFECLSLCLS